MRELSWANKAQIDCCCHWPNAAILQQCRFKDEVVRWVRLYQLHRGNCNSTLEHVTMGAIVTVLQCVTIG